jgi:hypothetical protein
VGGCESEGGHERGREDVRARVNMRGGGRVQEQGGAQEGEGGRKRARV